jgi:nitrite reductase (NAD(P)H)
MSFEARESPEDPEQVQVLLPPASELDAHLGTDKWLIRQAESEALGLNAATQVSILGPRGEFLEGSAPSNCGGGDGCGDHKLSW